MIKHFIPATLRSAYGAGWRARKAPALYRPAPGRRGVLARVMPLNPYHNSFNPLNRPLLAIAWALGRKVASHG